MVDKITKDIKNTTPWHFGRNPYVFQDRSSIKGHENYRFHLEDYQLETFKNNYWQPLDYTGTLYSYVGHGETVILYFVYGKLVKHHLQ